MARTPSSSPTVDLPRLRAAFDGRVTAPGDPGYDQARALFYGGWDRHPGAIVRPSDAAEVAQVVTLARRDRAGAGRPRRRPQQLPGTAPPRAGSSSTCPS